MVIVVPDISVDGRRFGSVPEPPSNPPTYIDVANALRLSTHLVHQYTSGAVPADDVAKAVIYQQQLLATDAGIEPPWFVEAMTRLLEPVRDSIHTGLAEVRASLAVVENRLTAVENRLQQLTAKQAQVQRYTAKAYNLQQGIGPDIQYQIVPFPDNSDPTQPPHSLPPLTSYAAVTGLNTPRRNRYYRLYTSTPAAILPSAERQTNDILLAVGISPMRTQ